jgi:hypothetical protein
MATGMADAATVFLAILSATGALVVSSRLAPHLVPPFHGNPDCWTAAIAVGATIVLARRIA